MNTLRPLRGQRGQRGQRGFSLIEVLVAVVVIAVGLLGIAKMHALAIGNTRVSASRSVAAIYAGSLSSAMHANPGYWQVVRPTAISVSTSANTDRTAAVLSSGPLQSLTAVCAAAGAANTPPVCTVDEMAAYDLRTWGTSLLQLPDGAGTVTCSNDATVPVTCSITIQWSEKYIAVNAAGVNADAQVATQRLVVMVQP